MATQAAAETQRAARPSTSTPNDSRRHWLGRAMVWLIRVIDVTAAFGTAPATLCVIRLAPRRRSASHCPFAASAAASRAPVASVRATS